MAETADDSHSVRAFTPALNLRKICILINYVDRGNLSIAARVLLYECGMSGYKLVFFFSSRRRHTTCYRDWSSDVCSSILVRRVSRATVRGAGLVDDRRVPCSERT